jgi:hypothetical protein
VAALAPTRDARCVVERQVEAAQVEQQADAFLFGRPVIAISVGRAGGRWEQTASLVESQRAGAHPELAGDLADAHPVSVRSASPAVKVGRG